jgi:BirA family biotin operon repressor/biotin-[acetyl-CoA-carboxylase] ligase
MFDLPRISGAGLVRHVDWHESLGSTNDRALELAARGGEPPLLVLTERQTGGRGRGTNRWHSAPGALTFSLVLDASAEVVAPGDLSQAALVAGLAVCEALEGLAPQAAWRVKWPNDVYADGRKLCGILCESAQLREGRLVIGIGINVNNSLSAADLPFAAGALVDLDGQVRDLTTVLIAVLARLEARWQEFLGQGFVLSAAGYRARCLLSGKWLTVASGPERLVGFCQGIDDAGALLLTTERGPRTVVSGSVDVWE